MCEWSSDVRGLESLGRHGEAMGKCVGSRKWTAIDSKVEQGVNYHGITWAFVHGGPYKDLSAC